MAAADVRAIASGTAPLALMDRAAGAVVRAIRGRYARRPVSIVCGPGQNGGDGWAIAWMLGDFGWDVRLHSAVPVDRLEGAAREAAERAGIVAEPLADLEPGSSRLVVDALFGAGLSRDLQGAARGAAEAMTGATVVAVDLPSGVHGATGAVMGAAPRAELTVTFHAPKPGHLLQPGASRCGEVLVADIGLDDEGAPDAWANGAALWSLRLPDAATHKYARGSVVVATGGHESAGAGRLAAQAAARAGAGAVTLASPLSALDVNANACDAIMVRRMGDGAELAQLVAEKNSTAVLGPGMGRSDATRDRVLAVLNLESPCVLDADALTVFEDDPDTLFALTAPAHVLTPHEGEFARLFGDPGGSKIDRARAAAERAGCTVLLKGADTVIAAPGQVPIVEAGGPPWLATAGSGDTLAGVIGALLSQGMSAREAAAAGARLHAEAGRLGGAGLTADDLAALVGRAYADALR